MFDIYPCGNMFLGRHDHTYVSCLQGGEILGTLDLVGRVESATWNLKTRIPCGRN